MALHPIHARERDALGLLKAHSSDYDSASEGGLVVELAADGTDIAVSNYSGGGATDPAKHGLLDEQASSKETMLGKYLPPNQAPVVLGPATMLASGRVSVCLESGWFLTDNYDLAVDAYGEASAVAPGGDLTCSAAGQLNVGGDATRCKFMKMVNDLDDLLASQVSPAPSTGLFAEQAPILIYQA
jgi:hypothetical protein